MAVAHALFPNGVFLIALYYAVIVATAATELVISVSDVVRGEHVTLTLTGGLPNTEAVLAFSFAGPGLDYMGKYDVVSGLAESQSLPVGETDSSGSLTVKQKLDQNFGYGEITVWVQIIQTGVASNVVERDIEGATPGYEVGCMYPKSMPAPLALRDQMASNITKSIIEHWTGIETPVVVYVAGLGTICPWNCVAYHSGTALIAKMDRDPRPPRFRVPEFGRDSWSRALCMMACAAELYTQDGALPVGPVVHGKIVAAMKERGFYPETLDPRLRDCWEQQSWSCVDRFVAAHGFSPYVVGQVAALEIKDETRERRAAWNADGHMRWDFTANASVPCTANCQPFGDTTGYVPRNLPGRPVNEADKYKVEGVDRRWQPLQEFTDGGFAFRQEHVTPHLINAAPLALRTGWKTLSDPAYDYKLQADLVVSRVAEMAANQTQKDAVEYFDDKRTVRRLIQSHIQSLLKPTFEQFLLFLIGLDASEHDTLVQAWREKVKHDLVRPTTVIQRWNEDKLITFNGNRSSTEPAEIAARDFQPYIRVMPHAEYPSGSACLCSGYTEFTDTFTARVFGTTLGELADFGYKKSPGGSNPFSNCLNTDTVQQCGKEHTVFKDLSEYAHWCGVSRLWGGMHFTDAVPDGEMLCKGIGSAADEKTQSLQGMEDLSIGYQKGDKPPKCSM